MHRQIQIQVQNQFEGPLQSLRVVSKSEFKTNYTSDCVMPQVQSAECLTFANLVCSSERPSSHATMLIDHIGKI